MNVRCSQESKVITVRNFLLRKKIAIISVFNEIERHPTKSPNTKMTKNKTSSHENSSHTITLAKRPPFVSSTSAIDPFRMFTFLCSISASERERTASHAHVALLLAIADDEEEQQQLNRVSAFKGRR